MNAIRNRNIFIDNKNELNINDKLICLVIYYSKINQSSLLLDILKVFETHFMDILYNDFKV